MLDNYGKLLFTKNHFKKCLNVFVVPNGFSLTLPIHMARINKKYLYEYSNFQYLPNLSSALKSHKIENKIQNDNLVIFYTSEDQNALLEANNIKKLLNNNVKLIKDPSKEMIKKESLKADSIHIIAHKRNGKIIFLGNEFNGFDFCHLLPDNLANASFSVCNSGEINQEAAYPIEHISWVHTLIEKNTKRILTHSWDLGQEASRTFTLHYFQNLLVLKK